MKGLVNNLGFEAASSQGHTKVGAEVTMASLYHPLSLHWGEINTSCRCECEVCSCYAGGGGREREKGEKMAKS